MEDMALSVNTCFKKRFRRIVATLCILCFVFVAFLSTPLVIAFASHEHELLPGCFRAHGHICGCDNDNGMVLLITRAIERSFIHISSHNHGHKHNHGDMHIECLQCASIEKIVNPLRQHNYVDNGIILVDYDIFPYTAIYREIIIEGVLTPIEFKTKMNN